MWKSFCLQLIQLCVVTLLLLLPYFWTLLQTEYNSHPPKMYLFDKKIYRHWQVTSLCKLHWLEPINRAVDPTDICSPYLNTNLHIIKWMNRVLKYEHFEGYFVVLGLILPEIQWFLFPMPLNFGSKRASMSVSYDIIVSVIAGLPKVYPNFLDVPHSVLQQCEEKLRAPLMHTGTPSA